MTALVGVRRSQRRKALPFRLIPWYHQDFTSSTYQTGWTVGGSAWSRSGNRLETSGTSGATPTARLNALATTDDMAMSVRVWRSTQRLNVGVRLRYSPTVPEHLGLSWAFGSPLGPVNVSQGIAGVSTNLGTIADVPDGALVHLVAVGDTAWTMVDGKRLTAWPLTPSHPDGARGVYWQAGTANPRWRLDDLTVYDAELAA